MMNRIKLLPQKIIDEIAAGEVVVNPASVLKELIENSIDAGSKNIIIKIENGGKTLIAVSDDGDGIHREDISFAFLRNATSKIDDSVDAIETLGFRGEALASIAYVSKITLVTKSTDEEVGTKAEITENKINFLSDVASKTGTDIHVRDLFYNIPARYKHLKKNSIETENVIDVTSKAAIAHPEISFQLICDGYEKLFTDGSNDLEKSILAIYGKEVLKGLILIEFDDDPLFVTGLISSPNYVRERNHIRLLILNGRYVESKSLNHAIDSVYQEHYGKKSGDYILFIRLPYHMVDVNIHPAKLNVKLMNESLIMMLIKQGIKDSLKQSFVLKNTEVSKKNIYDFQDIKSEKLVFESVEPYVPFKNESSTSDHSIIKNLELSEEAKSDNDEYETVEKSLEFRKTLSLNRDIFAHLAQMKYIGNVFGIYALIESGDEMYAIDTHAAHERVLYEKYLEAYNKRSIHSQTLLIPKIIDFGISEHAILLENVSTLQQIGLEIEDFGNNSIILRTIPYDFYEMNTELLIDRLIDTARSFRQNEDISDRSEKLIKAACHNAVRGKEIISENETRDLLKNLSQCEMPFACPHGRPVIGRLSIQYFMKVFERI
ncbi:MAG: DNA mismatch repair endonuclease MutL [Eubacteriales bacterium]